MSKFAHASAPTQAAACSGVAVQVRSAVSSRTSVLCVEVLCPPRCPSRNTATPPNSELPWLARLSSKPKSVLRTTLLLGWLIFGLPWSSVSPSPPCSHVLHGMAPHQDGVTLEVACQMLQSSMHHDIRSLAGFWAIRRQKPGCATCTCRLWCSTQVQFVLISWPVAFVPAVGTDLPPLFFVHGTRTSRCLASAVQKEAAPLSGKEFV